MSYSLSETCNHEFMPIMYHGDLTAGWDSEMCFHDDDVWIIEVCLKCGAFVDSSKYIKHASIIDKASSNDMKKIQKELIDFVTLPIWDSTTWAFCDPKGKICE